MVGTDCSAVPLRPTGEGSPPWDLAGVKVSPHVLRHTFGAEFIDQGENLRKVAELLGHASINTTMRYTKVRDRAKVEAVRKLEINQHGPRQSE